MTHVHARGSSTGHRQPIEQLKLLAHGVETSMNQMHNAEGVDHDGSTHRGLEVVLNAAFVDEVGRRRAEELCDLLEDLGRLTHHRREEIRTEMVTRLAEIGLGICPVEVERFADEVSRSDWVRARATTHIT